MTPAGLLHAQEKKGTIVTINYARHTDYEKNEASGNEIIVMTGNVSMTVEKGNTRIDIEASSVRYDRKTSMLFAQGDVVLKTGGSGGHQDATADSMLLNTDTLEGIFDNSRIVRYGDDDTSIPTGSTLVASSKIMGTGPSGTIAFKKATISFCDDENPHWKIKASKAWMLPGGEFAFLNALLYVGPVPLLYLPAFYYPKDELIFNPVAGYDARRGYFVQTTTYLWGRKPLSAYGTDSDDGSFSFGRPSKLKDQVREGIILHNLDTDYDGEARDYLKLTADYYSRLGGMVGLDGNYTGGGLIPSVTGFFDVGFSNTIFYDAGADAFSRYGRSAEGVGRFKDSASFLGIHTPFRYALSLSADGSGNGLDYSLSLPIYSDPYFLTDYGSRKEYMDWISFLTRSSFDEVSEKMKATDEDSRTVSSFSWDANASYSFPSLVALAGPFLSNMDFRLASSANFSSWKRTDSLFKEQASAWKLYSPERKIFYPSLLTPIRLSLSTGGSLYSYPPRAETESGPDDGGKDGEEGDVSGPPEEDGTPAEATGGSSPLFTMDDIPSLDDIQLPQLAAFNGFQYNLGYRLDPSYVSQRSYSAALLFPDDTDFDWSKTYSTYYELGSPVVFTNKLSYRDKFFSVTNDLTFDPHFQKHPDLDGYTTQASKDSVLNADYGAKRFDINDSNTVSLRPFVYNGVLFDSGLDWKSNVRLLRTEYVGDAASPDWDYLPAKADDESISVHTLTGYVVAKESDKTSQKFTSSFSLAPRAGDRDFMMDLTFPHVECGFSTGVERIDAVEEDEEPEFRDKPFKQYLTVSLLKDLKLTETYNFNREEYHHESLRFAVSGWGFQAAYTMQHAYGYEWDPLKGWTAAEEKDFIPYSLSLSYSSPSKKFRYWFNRITWAPSLQSSFVYDLARPAESYFTFIPAMTFRINQFLYLTFSSESRNSVVFRYFEDFTEYGDIISGEKNPFKDLADSFALWDMDRRKASGFKVKNFKMTLAHNLHDWTFATSYVFKPRLIKDEHDRSVYSYDPAFSFIISWRPMSGLRTQVTDEYGEVQLNP